MAIYNHTTRAVFRETLIKALDSDPTVINFWPETRLNFIIQQAYYTFGALSGAFKDNIQINTVAAKRLYNIFSDTTGLSCAPTLSYGDIVNWINIDFIENISVLNPVSDLFTLDELLVMIDSKYNLYQLETNLIIRTVNFNVLAENNSIKLTDDVLDIVRLKYKYTVDGINYEVILQREDEENISYFDPEALTEEGISIYYSTVYGNANDIKLYPIPNITGTLEVIYVGTKLFSDTNVFGTQLWLPNNLAPYIKYMVEQDIYNKDGVLNSHEKAAYCAKRAQEGITIGKYYSSILTSRANNLPIDTDSLNKLDDYTDTLVPTDEAPHVLGLAGYNVFEIDNLPNSTVNSLFLSIVKDAPLLTSDADFIEIEIAYIEGMLNYCVHLAQLKCGAYELAATDKYLDDFIKISIANNKRLQNKGVSYQTLIGKPKLEEIQIPRLAKEQQVNG